MASRYCHDSARTLYLLVHLQPGGESMSIVEQSKPTIETFLPMTQAQLTERLVNGHPIEPSALDNTEYKGISLGLPAFVDRLAWKTFKKVFHRDPDTGALRGWNIRIEQTGLYGPYKPMLKKGEPFTWGHYGVVSNANRPCGKRTEQALLLDYGLGKNAWYDVVTSATRDPLVALEPGSVDTLLGWSYLQFGFLRIPTPSFFLLVRDGPLTRVVQPPRARAHR